MRRGARLALRHPVPGLQGEPLRRARGDRARPARQGRAGTARRARQVALYDDAVAELAGIEPLARDARDMHAHPPVRRPRRRRARGCDARRVPARARRGAHLDEHPLPARAPADRVPRALPRSAAAAGRRAGRRRGAVAAALAGALRRRHPGRDRRAAPRARARSRHEAAGSVRVGATLVVTGLCIAYILWKIDLGRRSTSSRDAEPRLLPRSPSRSWSSPCWPMAWRWQQLLAGRGIHDRLRWLTRAYFIAYTAGQVLPTSVGGDAMRIFETAERIPGHGGPIAGLGAARARARRRGDARARRRSGSCSRSGHYDVGAYLWVELAFVVGTVVLAVVLFSRRVRPPLAGRCRCCAGSASSGRSARSTRASTPTATTRGCSPACSC